MSKWKVEVKKKKKEEMFLHHWNEEWKIILEKKAKPW